jgi:hypothetical protein
MSAHEKEVFMDETAGPEELSQKVKDQTAEVKETASAAADQARRTANAAWNEAKSKISDLQSLEARRPICTGLAARSPDRPTVQIYRCLI